MTNDDTKFELRLKDAALVHTANMIHQMLDNLRDAGLTTRQWANIAISDLRRYADELDSRWTYHKHKRARERRYWTAADWLEKQHGKPQPSKDAVALGRLALAYTRKHKEPCSFYGDDVIELLKGRSIVRYFPEYVFEIVTKYNWTPKTDALVEAELQLSFHEGPLKPPPSIATKKAGTRKGGRRG